MSGPLFQGPFLSSLGRTVPAVVLFPRGAVGLTDPFHYRGLSLVPKVVLCGPTLPSLSGLYGGLPVRPSVLGSLPFFPESRGYHRRASQEAFGDTPTGTPSIRPDAESKSGLVPGSSLQE